VPTVARRLLIAVVVVVLLLVLADRIGDYVAEKAAADTIKNSQHLNSTPNVDIAGFPFLTQLAAGDFSRITITAKDVPVGRQSALLDVSRLQVVLHKITVSRSFSRVHADTADATATVTYAELGRTLGVRLTYAGNGRIRASRSVTVAGQTASGSVTARPALSGNALTFHAIQVDGAASLPDAVINALDNVFRLDIPLKSVPFNIRVKALHTTEAGISIDLSGTDLSYAKS
jgi:hypothetical protein